MISSLKNHYLPLILLALALTTRLLFLWYPAEVVFDEVHFGKFVSAYFTHEYYFDIHPPLGKLIIAGWAGLWDVRPDVSFEKIGQGADDRELFILRFLPALSGALLVLIIYQIALALGMNQRAAFLAGWLVIFDNAFLVESKFILVDSFLFFFGFLAIWLFWLSRNQTSFARQIFFCGLAALSAGLAFSIKWTGLAFWGLTIAMVLFDFLKSFSSSKRVSILLHSSILKEALKILIFFSVLFLVYVIPFYFHFKLLPLPGPGDAYLSQNFQQLPFGQKFLELNQKMWFYNSTLDKTHPDASQWFEWPWGKKPIWYWQKTVDNRMANIYLFGNPLVFWFSLVAILAGVWRLLKKRELTTFFLLVGFFASLLPFALVSRVAFLYHYLPALGFAILISALLFQKTAETRSPLFFGYLLLVLVTFLFIAPISYGFLLNAKTAAVYQWLAQLFH
jgi:dolichyl-phosphate-mannose-protein mannosyltransferase